MNDRASAGCPPALVNAVSVETPQGLRTFELHSGDILGDRTDLLVISTHHNPRQPPTGHLVSTLKERFGFSVDVNPHWISFGEGVSACVQGGDDRVPFRTLLTMRIARSGSQADPIAFYDRAVRATFAATAALEFMGGSFATLSLPVLSGRRIVDYPAAVQSLLRHAFAWLRRSRDTEVVRYYVFEPDELQQWDQAMNTSLGRSYVDAAHEFVARSLCQEIVARIDGGGLSKAPADLAASLRHALSDPERLSVQTVATFGRKLAEAVTEELCCVLGIAVQRELINNIEAVRRGSVVADWIVSYLHSLRVFGNEGVHSLAGKRQVIPSRLSSEDLVSLLSAIRALMSFWEEWSKRATRTASQ